jgi:hypothetical protein
MTRALALVVVAALVTSSPSFIEAQAPASIELPANTPCGTDANGRVNVNSRVEVDFMSIEMTSSLPATVSVPPSIKVGKGGTFGSFEVRCLQGTQSVTATITARANGGTATASINVLAPALQSITVQPHTGGTSVQGQATLIGRAPPGGVVVALSSNSDRANVPQSVTVPAGVASAPFTITTRVVTQPTPVQILGTGFGVSKTADLVVQPPVPTSVTFGGKDRTFINSRNVVGGSPVQDIKVTLSTSAPSGYSVQLSSNNPALIAVPSSVTFDGATPDAIITTAVATVSQPTIVNITATAGATSKIGLIQVLPPSLDDVSVVPFTATGGQTVAFRIRLNGAAPSAGLSGQVSTTNPAAVTVPASFTVPAGSSSVEVPIQAARLERSTSVTVSASAGGVTKNASLNVEPEGPTSITLSPSSVIGGTSVNMKVERVPSPEALVVDLASDKAAATIPSSATFASNQASISVVISTTGVAASTSVSITAKKGAVVKGAILLVKPPAVTQLTLSPATVTAGQLTTAQITIGTPAPQGFVVALSTLSSAGGSTLTYNIPVPTGTTTASYTFGTLNSTQRYSVNVTAATPSGSKTAFLTVNPP